MVEQVSALQRTSWIFNSLFQRLVGVVTVFLLWIFFYNYKLNTYYTWHYILCTLAYVPLMAEAVILFWGDNLWSQTMDRKKKYWIHGVLLGLSGISVTIGIAVLLHNSKPNAKHFKSNHGLTGVISWVLVLLSVILGFFSANAQRLKSIFYPVYFKFIHNLIGIAGYVIGMVSLAYGVNYSSVGRYCSQPAQKAIIWSIGVITFWSLIASFKSLYNQMKSIIQKSD